MYDDSPAYIQQKPWLGMAYSVKVEAPIFFPTEEFSTAMSEQLMEAHLKSPSENREAIDTLGRATGAVHLHNKWFHTDRCDVGG